MKITFFEILSKEDKIYQELMEQYEVNLEVKESLNRLIIPSEMALMGDFRLITMLNHAINIDNIKVYLVKDVENDIFVCLIGKFIDDGKFSTYLLTKEKSKELELGIRSVIIEINNRSA